MVDDEGNARLSERARKKPVRSEHLFPLYDLGTALRLTERVERDGGGSLTEETLAIALGVSSKSSSFRLRGLTARQFGLLTKQGPSLVTTPLGKSILKPTSQEERAAALATAFLSMPLFKAVADRFASGPLPQGTALRNILEREMRVEPNRVTDAERVLLDSAREAGVLQGDGDDRYLAFATTSNGQTSPQAGPEQPTSQPLPSGNTRQEASLTASREVVPFERGMLQISEADLADFGDQEFSEIWNALGKIVRARGRRMRTQESRAGTGRITDQAAGLDEASP